MFEVDFHILNQKATPAIYADTLALRPAAGFAGRLFVATDSPYGVFRDTGTAWVQVASNGGGGGGSTGVNGLNGTTNIGLGGTITNNVNILGGDFDFVISSLSNCFIGVNTLNTDFANISMNSVLNNPKLRLLAGINGLETSIYVEKNKFYSLFNLGKYGLLLDDTNGKFCLGDYNNDRKYNSIVVNDDDNTFYLTTSFNQNNTNQDLFYAKNATDRFVKIGDFNNYNNGISLEVDDANQFIKTTSINGTNGFLITNTYSLFGSYNATNYLFLNVDSNSTLISTRSSAMVDNGLLLNFDSNLFKFGGFGLNNNYIQVDDTNNIFEFFTSEIKFTGSNLQSGFSGGNTGEHLVITLNNQQYKIALQSVGTPP